MTSWKNAGTKKAITGRTNPRNKDYGCNDDNNSIIITVPLACLSDTGKCVRPGPQAWPCDIMSVYKVIYTVMDTEGTILTQE